MEGKEELSSIQIDPAQSQDWIELPKNRALVPTKPPVGILPGLDHP